MTRRVDLPCQVAGFDPPPCRIELRFEFGDESGWMMLARTPPAQPSNVATWLEAYEPTAIQIPPGLAPKALRARFDELPDVWHRILSTVDLQFMALNPDGVASLFVNADPAAFNHLVETLRRQAREAPGAHDACDVRARPAHTRPDDASLTPRQREILARAVAYGYYEIPHNVTLRELADRLDLTVGTVSELLRRAEAAIITNHVDAWMANRWNGDADLAASETWTLAPDSQRA